MKWTVTSHRSDGDVYCGQCRIEADSGSAAIDVARKQLRDRERDVGSYTLECEPATDPDQYADWLES